MANVIDFGDARARLQETRPTATVKYFLLEQSPAALLELIRAHKENDPLEYINYVVVLTQWAGTTIPKLTSGRTGILKDGVDMDVYPEEVFIMIWAIRIFGGQKYFYAIRSLCNQEPAAAAAIMKRRRAAGARRRDLFRR